MSASSSNQSLFFQTSEARPVWTVSFDGIVRKLSLARETGWLLAFDESGWLTLLDEKGSRQAHRRFDSRIIACAAADNGSAFVVGDGSGKVWWLKPDLTPWWERQWSHPVTTIGIDGHGDAVIVGDVKGGVTLLTHKGKSLWTKKLPRPLEHVQFATEKPVVIAAAELGLVVALDAQGEIIWQDRLVSRVGSLSISGDAEMVLLACFGDGLWRYDASGPPAKHMPMRDPCQHVSLSYNGGVILTSGLRKRFCLVDLHGKVLGEQKLDATVTALQMSPVADYAVLALTDGRVMQVRLAMIGKNYSPEQ